VLARGGEIPKEEGSPSTEKFSWRKVHSSATWPESKGGNISTYGKMAEEEWGLLYRSRVKKSVSFLIAREDLIEVS